MIGLFMKDLYLNFYYCLLSPFETTCTAEEIDHHISMLEVRNYILETDGFFSSGDMETTKQRLLHVFLPPLLSKDVATIAADTTASNADSAPSAEKIDIAQDFIYLECDWQRRATLLGYLQKVNQK